MEVDSLDLKTVRQIQAGVARNVKESREKRKMNAKVYSGRPRHGTANGKKEAKVSCNTENKPEQFQGDSLEHSEPNSFGEPLYTADCSSLGLSGGIWVAEHVAGVANNATTRGLPVEKRNRCTRNGNTWPNRQLLIDLLVYLLCKQGYARCRLGRKYPLCFFADVGIGNVPYTTFESTERLFALFDGFMGIECNDERYSTAKEYSRAVCQESQRISTHCCPLCGCFAKRETKPGLGREDSCNVKHAESLSPEQGAERSSGMHSPYCIERVESISTSGYSSSQRDCGKECSTVGAEMEEMLSCASAGPCWSTEESFAASQHACVCLRSPGLIYQVQKPQRSFHFDLHVQLRPCCSFIRGEEKSDPKREWTFRVHGRNQKIPSFSKSGACGSATRARQRNKAGENEAFTNKRVMTFVKGTFDAVPKQATVVRAMNVTRSYPVHHLKWMTETLGHRLEPGSIFLDGTTDDLGHRGVTLVYKNKLTPNIGECRKKGYGPRHSLSLDFVVFSATFGDGWRLPIESYSCILPKILKTAKIQPLVTRFLKDWSKYYEEGQRHEIPETSTGAQFGKRAFVCSVHLMNYSFHQWNTRPFGKRVQSRWALEGLLVWDIGTNLLHKNTRE